ncbi:helicase-related protein [Cerasicoccus arenae]|uniref:Helicase n=1 Tax=Cerasicoccus arenae TaxID=424488 RepID=A0A8J3DKJ5_9BACT|nr:helicase-related protein [Cerasicoccus arenae]MBK1857779.1 DUF3883 domain-containing protein [Cerasicoccus arenae]GHC12011.1 helicase [Cerasicoccus arenae]
MTLEEITKGSVLKGIAPSGESATILAVDTVGDDAITVYYKVDGGPPAERMVFRTDESTIERVEQGLPWNFDGNAETFKLAAEAYRIHLAHLFDPLMAVHTSAVDPLPHQITAVYETMLPRQPLRFLLADDPGAGKTIMAGLLIKELIVRGDLKRCLIVAPGVLVDQWQDELDLKFGLQFDIFSREMVETTRSGNPFEEKDLLIARIDQLARNEELQSKLENTDWDLIVVDEAHKMSANYFGNKLNKTKRYQLGEKLGQLTRHFLLMTATPHNGKEEDFQAFMALIDSDRFYGRFRDGVHQVDPMDLMRRMVKEELLKFDGTPLFPERRAHSCPFKLSELEGELYRKVTNYVVNEMNRAAKLSNNRRGTVGFALTILQRRLASSPEAIYQSLKRRLHRLDRMLEEAKLNRRGLSELGNFDNLSDDDIDDFYDDHSDEEVERLEDEIADRATAAQTIQELEAEIISLRDLVAQAKEVRASNEDHKWVELRELLLDNPEMYEADGKTRRKIIIFTEHRDTLNYLFDRITALLGDPEVVVTIHGGVRREERRKVQEQFTQNKAVSVLLATDAAGEGVNLQRANLMINYDLPWNPNRLEQRFGRIHRIGQTEVCHLWNLVAHETREGDVYAQLLVKLEAESDRLEGKVFDILGQVIDNKSLRELLMEAIQYGDRPEVRARLHQQIDSAFDPERIRLLAEQNALASEHMTAGRVFEIKEQMERAEALRLQPYFIYSFFEAAFAKLGGQLKKRETGRYEITHVPAAVRQRDRVIGAGMPVLKKYERLCFEKERIRIAGKPMASLLCPGHPLMDAVIDLILERSRSLLKQGSILIDCNQSSETPRLLCILDHSIRDGGLDRFGQQRTISRQLQFLSFDEAGNVHQEGPAPYLDFDIPEAHELAQIESFLEGSNFGQEIEKKAIAYSAKQQAPGHFDEARKRRENYVDATLNAVHERLTKEINYWSHRYAKLKAEEEAGKQPRMQPENARRRAEELTERLEHRTKELRQQRAVFSTTPVVVGGALVISQGWLDRRQGKRVGTFSADAEARKRIEMIGMDAVMEMERKLGYEPHDVSAENLGWDVQSRAVNGEVRFIEVKARMKGADVITVTKNEILASLNQPARYYLAIVLVDGDQIDGPHYVQSPFDRELGFGVTSQNIDISKFLEIAQPPVAFEPKRTT